MYFKKLLSVGKKNKCRQVFEDGRILYRWNKNTRVVASVPAGRLSESRRLFAQADLYVHAQGRRCVVVRDALGRKQRRLPLFLQY